MAKYVIECLDCGSYVEVGTGLFAKKKVKCTCGHVINTSADIKAKNALQKIGADIYS